MEIPGFRFRAVTLGKEGAEELRLAYVDNETDGPCILLLHGLFDSKATWSRLCPLLGRDYRVVAPDLVGCGRSSKPLLAGLPRSYRYSADMHVDLVQRFVERLGLSAMVLGGSSLGGGLALRLYLDRPAVACRVRGLVLIAAAGYRQELPGRVQDVGGWLGHVLSTAPARVLLRLGLDRRLVLRTFRRAFHDASRIPPDLVEEAASVLRLPNALQACRLAASSLVPDDLDELSSRFRTVHCPTLLLWGESDRIVPASFARRFKADIPHAELHVMPACGHAPHLECPEWTAGLMRAWMQRHVRRATA